MSAPRGTGTGERDFPSETKHTEDYRQLQPKAEEEKVLPHMSVTEQSKIHILGFNGYQPSTIIRYSLILGGASFKYSKKSTPC